MVTMADPQLMELHEALVVSALVAPLLAVAAGGGGLVIVLLLP